MSTIQELVERINTIERAKGILDALTEATFHIALIDGTLEAVVKVDDLHAIAKRLTKEATE